MSNSSQQTNEASNAPPPMPPPVANPIDYRSPNLGSVQGQSTAYEHVADKVGMVPSLRGSDNLISLLGLVIGGAIGGTAGMVIGALPVAIGGGVVGGFAGVILAGLYLGIRNLFRK
jgi:hypothetical protein